MLRKVDIIIGGLFLTILVVVGSTMLWQMTEQPPPPANACEEACLRQVQNDLMTMAAYEEILTRGIQELYTQVEQLRQELHATEQQHGQDQNE